MKFNNMILTGERKKVNKDFARQELFLISETNQPAEAGFFIACGCAFRPQVQDIDIFRDAESFRVALNHAKFVAFEFKEVLAVDKTVATSLPTNQQKKPRNSSITYCRGFYLQNFFRLLEWEKYFAKESTLCDQRIL